MKLKLDSFSVYQARDGGSPAVGATLEIVFSQLNSSVIHAGGTVFITFEHPTPDSLTFAEVERLAKQWVLALL